eukprot:618103_1
MTPLQRLFVYLCLLFQNGQSQGLLANEYKKLTGPNGEDIWESTSWFQAGGAHSYGTIKIGQVMVMEFDFRYMARVNSPTEKAIENFFRVGHSGTEGGCSEGTRYPSLWLDDNTKNDNGFLTLSYSSGDTCDVSKTLWNYPQVSKLADTSIWTHIIITIDWTTVTIELTGGDKVDKTYSWNREITKKADLGDEVPVWFGSDGGWNIGNCKLRNIVITSSVFTYSPTPAPTANPTPAPTDIPTSVTFYPSNAPTLAPSSAPTSPPSSAPSLNPTLNPSLAPTTTPSATPTQPPTFSPTLNPSLAPSQPPTAAPSQNPSATPSQPPTKEPSAIPTTPPSNQPSMPPTLQPTHPTSEPTGNPTPEIPTIANPSKSPTRNPSEIPSPNPSSAPTSAPTLTPTFNPSKSPSQSPSIAPSGAPTVTRNPTPDPTAAPSSAPSAPPTKNPSASPSSSPSSAPSNNPSLHPTITPSAAPSKDPSVSPTTDAPTEHPSSDPTKRPSLNPSVSPTTETDTPTVNPVTETPTSDPTLEPTVLLVTSIYTTDSKTGGEKGEIKMDLYAYLFYGAIAFVCVFLIVVAVCCYCKFKPVKDEVNFNYDVTPGHTKDNSQPKERMRVALDGHGTPLGMTPALHADNRNAAATPVHDTSRTLTEEMNFNESDEDVLKGAYGGYIKGSVPIHRNTNGTANTNHTMPQRHPQHTTQPQAHAAYDAPNQMRGAAPDMSDRGLSSTGMSSTMDQAHHDINQHYYKHHHGVSHHHTPERARHVPAAQTDTYPNEETEYEEEETENENGRYVAHENVEYKQYDNEYSDEDESSSDEERYEDRGRGHEDGYRRHESPYIKARHPVDHDQEYLVQSSLEEEARREQQKHDREAAMRAIRMSEAQYKDQITHAAQQSTIIMDDIVEQMKDGHDGYTASSYTRTPNYENEDDGGYPQYQ